MVEYKLSEVPFSAAGSFLKITEAGTGSGRVMIGTARKNAITERGMDFWAHDFYEIALYKGETEVKYDYRALPWRLDLQAEEGAASFAFMDADTLVFEARGTEIRLLPCHALCWKHEPQKGEAVLLDHNGRCHHQARANPDADLEISRSLTVTGSKGAFHDIPYTLKFSGTGGTGGAIRFSDFGDIWEERLPSLEDAVVARQREYRAWMQKTPRVPEKYHGAAEMAWFILWNCTAKKEGEFTRRPVLMSKHWMNQIWAWDNCFNALALAKADPELAWEQLLLLFDKQAPNGMLPDSVNDRESRYGYVKPPVYGLTISKLLKILGRERCLPHLQEAYEATARLTQWWYNYRDADGDGMCQYHHGNDSGWDNATVFDQGFPTEGADLAAHLVLQLEGLAEMADVLGREGEAEEWRGKSAEQLKNLLTQGVKDCRFVSPVNGTHEAQPTQSLLNYIPMVLGRLIPDDIRRTIVRDLSPGGPFLTEYGLATEAPASPKYEPDGYWRGPIWAPSTYLIFDGLAGAGEKELACIIAERFCDMCVKEPAMYENYNALTGKGLRCPGYSWTAAVFLLLADWLGEGI
ncbi:MAG: amylo-alpha-1,6-glucosidase [Bacillota bacterium]